MAVFYKYQYTNKRKNIHPWNDLKRSLARGLPLAAAMVGTSKVPPPSSTARPGKNCNDKIEDIWYWTNLRPKLMTREDLVPLERRDSVFLVSGWKENVDVVQNSPDQIVW